VYRKQKIGTQSAPKVIGGRYFGGIFFFFLWDFFKVKNLLVLKYKFLILI